MKTGKAMMWGIVIGGLLPAMAISIAYPRTSEAPGTAVVQLIEDWNAGAGRSFPTATR